MAIVKSQEPPLHGDASPFTLAHLSDPHLTSPKGVTLKELLNKRVSGYLSWYLRRRHKYRAEVLSALLRDLDAAGPDHTVITGDLTHIGLPSEFQMVEKWLPSVGRPTEVTLVPGNHDAYVAADWDETFALWKDYMCSDDPQDDGTVESLQVTFPILRKRWQVALIGVSTARPSAPFLAIGRIGQAQSQRLEKVLEETGREGLLRIVLIHHPPVPGVVDWRKRLTDGGRLLSILGRQGAELVLHGHSHRTSLKPLDGPTSRIMAIGVPAASALSTKPGRRARYHIYRVIQNAQGWDVHISVRRYSFAEDCFVEEDERRLTLKRESSVPS
jgi:3',5'-cyclic AMP phosphodiesterase CpdA